MLAERLWDLWCVGTIVGIWPRYIEPRVLACTHLEVVIDKLPTSLDGLRIAQFSDLHLSDQVGNSFLKKLSDKLNRFDADIVVFTGDFLNYSILSDACRLKNLLCSLRARYGCYATFGNHDYDQYVSFNENGDYDVKSPSNSGIATMLKRLFTSTTLTGNATPGVSSVGLHEGLCQLLQETPFTVLHNATVTVPVNGSFLNVSGLGDFMVGKCLPEKTFKDYDPRYPGIVLAHNPDSIPKLIDYPGNVVLCGHTHGGAVMLPFIHKKLILLESLRFVRGLFNIANKTIYVNRGIGSTICFRWFSKPELLCLTLKAGTKA